MKEVTGVISDNAFAEITLLYEYLVIHKDSSSDLKFSELIGEIIEKGYPLLLKERGVHFEFREIS